MVHEPKISLKIGELLEVLGFVWVRKFQIFNAKDDTSAKSCTSSCGHIHNISYPFRLNDDPKYCGDVRYTLSCESNITVLVLPSSGKYYVQAINYNDKTIRLLYPGLVNTNCYSMPRNFPPSTDRLYFSWPSTSIYYLKCSNPLNSSLYVDTAPCLNNTSSSSSQPKTYIATSRSGPWNAEGMALGHFEYSVDYSNVSYKDIHNALVYGFELHFVLFGICQGWTRNDACFPDTIPGASTLD
ncbi:hypothetical protein DVH24_025628 [Malus domestica]|uniref:Wall-associated receptor kinase galacturonan-binding domain-containing protein n=1 Tax=Malus domestica TaxID=3750 RepID=A0A498KQC1_MALDO|nr:hypothetical protein DVH24_006209 [Malus domestica]RXI09746.1 hypothetical protein DVH24_025628 [Malus domestica]